MADTRDSASCAPGPESNPQGEWPQGNSTRFVKSALLPPWGPGAKALLSHHHVLSPCPPVLTDCSSRLAEPTSQSRLGCPWHTAWLSHTKARRLPPRAPGQLLPFRKQGRSGTSPAPLGQVSTCWEPSSVSECPGTAGVPYLCLLPCSLQEGKYNHPEGPIEKGLEGPGQSTSNNLGVHIPKVNN